MGSHFGLNNLVRVLFYLSLVSTSSISVCFGHDNMWRQIGEPPDTSNWINPHDMGLPTNEKAYSEVTTNSAEVTSLNNNLEELHVFDGKKENEDVRSKDVPDPVSQPSNLGKKVYLDLLISR